MKKFVLLPLMLMATPVHADNTEMCTSLSAWAETTMKLRQMGTPLSWFVENSAKDGPMVKRLAINLAAAAFKIPRRYTEQGRNEAVAEFGADMYNLCTKTLRDDTDFSKDGL